MNSTRIERIMRYIIFVAVLLTFGVCVFISCKYKDPAPHPDPALTNPYCNNPNAVNYNVGFPGTPDSMVCIYPRDLFVGQWLFHDSVYIQSSGLFIYADSFVLTITAVQGSESKMTASGFCGNVSISLTGLPTYVATVDTLEGDSVTIADGQRLCRIQDTVSGTFTKSEIDSTLIEVFLQVNSDTGITTHVGSARKM